MRSDMQQFPTPLLLLLSVLVIAQILGSCHASRTQVQRSSASFDTAYQYGHVVTLSGFSGFCKNCNTRFNERFEEEWRIAGFSTYWSSDMVIYLCEARWWWVVAPKSFFENVKTTGSREASECHMTANLGRLTLFKPAPRLALGTQSWDAQELTEDGWIFRPNAGIASVFRACGEYMQPNKCLRANCVWDEEKQECAAHWGILGTTKQLRIDDVRQGELGTCYLLGVLASLAHHHSELLQSRFVHGERWAGDRPAYTISYLLDGEPTLVSVDDAVPVGPSGEPAFGGFSKSHLFWPALFEKSWAKIFGNYKAVESGTGAEALKALTQAPVDIIGHEGHDLDGIIDTVDVNDLWRAMKDATEKRFPMVANSEKNSATNGIASGHCYAIIDVKKIKIDGAPRRVVHLYNPWGKNNYRGEVLGNEHQTGHFTMTIHEYMEAFSSTLVAYVRKGYVVSTYPIPLRNRQGVAKIRFNMASDKPFTIAVHWPHGRLFEAVGCDDLIPIVEMEVSQPPSAASKAKAQKSWMRRGYCEGWVKENPGRCRINFYALFCSETCNQVTQESPTTEQAVMGLSNIRGNFPGGKGEYTVDISASFRTPHGKMIDKLTVVVYADQEVTFEDAGSSLVDLSGGFLAEVNGTMSEDCLQLYNRRNELNNWEQIQIEGNDAMFPQALVSIAKPGDTCGDDARGINEDCAKYNSWRTFHEIMMAEPGSE